MGYCTLLVELKNKIFFFIVSKSLAVFGNRCIVHLSTPIFVVSFIAFDWIQIETEKETTNIIRTQDYFVINDEEEKRRQQQQKTATECY